jgi:hypothetical protein
MVSSAPAFAIPARLRCSRAMSNDLHDPLKPLSEVLKPDERQSFMVGTLADVHAELSALVLHTNVPVDVRQLFETAKNARLYAFFAFRFHQLAEMVGYQALEMALRERWSREETQLATPERPAQASPMLAGLLKYAAASGWIRNAGFQRVRARAENAARTAIQMEAIKRLSESPELEEVSLRDPTTTEIDERERTIDVVDIVVRLLPEFRNNLAHGSPKLMPYDMAMFRDICDAINMVFDGTPPIPVAKAVPRPGIHGIFRQHLSVLEPKRIELVAMCPSDRDSLPKMMPTRGVYLFSESGKHLYVGRTNSLRKRICCHCLPSAGHGMAPFAFRLAKEACGVEKATYRKGSGRADFLKREDGEQAFSAAKARIRAMQVRFVEEGDPIRQMLLEAYVALVHKTPYNDFDNH